MIRLVTDIDRLHFEYASALQGALDLGAQLPLAGRSRNVPGNFPFGIDHERLWNAGDAVLVFDAASPIRALG